MVRKWDRVAGRESWRQWYSYSVRIPFAAILALFLPSILSAQSTVSFPTADGGIVFADLYGNGDRGVVLAHGGPFNRESWQKQAHTLEGAGFRVLALDFRGYGNQKALATLNQ